MSLLLRMTGRILISVFVPCVVCAQSASPHYRFEAASVKPDSAAGPRDRPNYSGGPGSNDPGRISYTHVRLIGLIMKAYDLPPDQIAGREHLGDQKFIVNATMP